MKSPFFRSDRPNRTPALTICAGLALTSACHQSRFQSAPADEGTVETSAADAAACRGDACTDASVASSNDLESVISAPETTGSDEPSDAASGLDASSTEPTMTESEDAGTQGVPSGGSDTALVTDSSSNSTAHASQSTTWPIGSTTASNTLDSTSALTTSDATGASSTPIVDSDDAATTSPDSSDASPVVLADAAATDASVDAAVSDAIAEPADATPDATLDAALENDADAHFDAAEAEPPLTCQTTTLLPGIVRDFDEEHPDMEPCDDDGVDCSSERGLVAPLLGDDNKPVFVVEARDDDSTIQSAETFNQWFRDVEDVNVAIPFDLQLTTRPRMVVFDSDNPPAGSPDGFSVDPQGFFPIDDWNESERPHNYSFTYEVSSYVEFQSGDSLTIRGDDDIFVFIDRHLVIDLGGIHLPQEAIIEFDDIADEFNLRPNTIYEFHLFFAERHVEQSNLRLSTNGQFYNCTSE